MDVLTSKAARRSTRLRLEIPVNVTSLDRMRPFAEDCLMLVVSAHGCGFRSARALQLETPIMINGLSGRASVTARVANCIPMGTDGKYFLIGAALYTYGNVWGIADPPEDWKEAAKGTPAANPAKAPDSSAPTLKVKKQSWPYNVFTEGNETHAGRK